MTSRRKEAELLPPEELLAGVGVLAVIAYSLLAGADFGAGVWDLLARGPRAREQRQAIAEAIGPIWEANHVWMIFLIVILFSGYPPAFAALSIALFIPFHLVLIGIILRGASFVFRAHGAAAAGFRSAWGSVFGSASLFTPFLLGMCLGAVSAGRIRVTDNGVSANYWSSWTGPLSWVMGALALVQAAYLAAVYLCIETEGELREDFRKRALISSAVVVVIATAAFPVLITQAEHLWRGLTQLHVLPVVAAGMVLGLVSPWALWHRRFQLARLAAAGEVVMIIVGWALAQRPYIIYPDVTVANSAASEAMIKFTLWTLPFAAAILAPSLWLLYSVFKGYNPASVEPPAGLTGVRGTEAETGAQPFLVTRKSARFK